MFALADSDWKLIFGSGSGGRGRPVGKRWEEPYQLYNMREDIGETTNLINNPECASVLRRLMDWADKLGVLAEKVNG